MFNKINSDVKHSSKRSFRLSNIAQSLLGLSLVTAALGLGLITPVKATEFYHHDVIVKHHCVFKKVYVKGKYVVVKYWYDKYGHRHPIKHYIPGHYITKKVCG